jgi:hypothetical protein
LCRSAGRFKLLGPNVGLIRFVGSAEVKEELVEACDTYDARSIFPIRRLERSDWIASAMT